VVYGSDDGVVQERRRIIDDQLYAHFITLCIALASCSCRTTCMRLSGFRRRAGPAGSCTAGSASRAFTFVTFQPPEVRRASKPVDVASKPVGVVSKPSTALEGRRTKRFAIWLKCYSDSETLRHMAEVLLRFGPGTGRRSATTLNGPASATGSGSPSTTPSRFVKCRSWKRSFSTCTRTRYGQDWWNARRTGSGVRPVGTSNAVRSGCPLIGSNDMPKPPGTSSHRFKNRCHRRILAGDQPG